MLSYQHAFHAGNHADVIKHLCWLGVIKSLKKKEKPFTLYDSHAGAGLYDFTDDLSSKNKEYLTGIASLQDVVAKSSLLNDYVSLCQSFVSKDAYPGSPVISAELKRESDVLHAMELHPGEFAKLESNIAAYASSNAHSHKRDGFEGLIALTPPKPNRGAILIDPPYERANEYEDVVTNVERVLKRWQQAQIVIWYPLLSARSGNKHGASEAMCEKLSALQVPCFKAEMQVAENTHDAGMYGSGVMVLNPAWQLDTQLSEAMLELTEYLGEQSSSSVIWVNKDN